MHLISGPNQWCFDVVSTVWPVMYSLCAVALLRKYDAACLSQSHLVGSWAYGRTLGWPELPATNRELGLTIVRCCPWEELLQINQRRNITKQEQEQHLKKKLQNNPAHLTPVIPGGQDSFRQRPRHSLSQEHSPEHQPHPMNLGAVRHMAQVRECWHPGPRWGTWIICHTIRQKTVFYSVWWLCKMYGMPCLHNYQQNYTPIKVLFNFL